MTDEAIIIALGSEETVGLTLVGEARGEPIQGIVAVGSVIRNRILSNHQKYFTFKEVCLEPNQFSCWNKDDPNRALLMGIGEMLLSGANIVDIYIRQCFWVAKGIINGDIVDNTNRSIHYLTTKLFNENRPKWARHPVADPTIIGNQTFFNV